MAKEHKNLTGAELHIARFATGAGSPQGARLPGIAGEAYYDTQGMHLWIAYGTTATSWNGPFSVLTSAAGLPTNPAGFDGLLSGSDTTVQAALETLDDHNHDGRYALMAHVHAGVYAPVGHDHAGVYAPTSHTHPLSALTQSGAATGQVATWNGAAWTPATPAGGGGGASALNDLTDVDTATTPPTTGQALAWNGTVWTPQTVTGGASTLDALTDVDAPSPGHGQALAWDSVANKWVPTTISGGGGTGTLTVLNKTADYNIQLSELTRQHLFTNSGASGAVVLTLPNPSPGLGAYFCPVVDGQQLTIKVLDKRYGRICVVGDSTEYTSVTFTTVFQSLQVVAISNTLWVLSVVEGAAGSYFPYAAPWFHVKAFTFSYSLATWYQTQSIKVEHATDSITALSNWAGIGLFPNPCRTTTKFEFGRNVSVADGYQMDFATETKATVVGFYATPMPTNAQPWGNGDFSVAAKNAYYVLCSNQYPNRTDKRDHATDTGIALGDLGQSTNNATHFHNKFPAGVGYDDFSSVFISHASNITPYLNGWHYLFKFTSTTETWNGVVASSTSAASYGGYFAVSDGYTQQRFVPGTGAGQKWAKIDVTTYTNNDMPAGVSGFLIGHSQQGQSPTKFGRYSTTAPATVRYLTLATDTFTDGAAHGILTNYGGDTMGAW